MNTSLFIKNQLPNFITESYPKFIEFMEAYYDFLDQYNVSYETARDIDLTSDQLFAFIKREFLNKFPHALIDNNKLFWTIRNLYNEKGTINAVTLLFRIFFNESITVYQPGENILRASDGRWNFEKSIILKRLNGEFDPNKNITLIIDNDYGKFFIDVNRLEIIDSSTTKFFFKNIIDYIITPNQIVEIKEEGNIVYRGLIERSPSSLNIISPGKYWKIGQVFTIEGDIVDSICRVTQIGPQGQLLGLEIYDFGYNHSENQLSFISPFPNKPIGGNVNYIRVIQNYDPISQEYEWLHTLTLDETIDQPNEAVTGFSDNQSFLTYFSGDYNTNTGDGYYSGSRVFNQTVITTSNTTNEITQVISPEQYQESITVLEFKFDDIVTYRGEFLGDYGILSNDNIRLQDNFFYQMFSYVIETEQNIDDYRNILEVVHPSGLKYFGSLGKLARICIDRDIKCSVSLSSLFLETSVTAAYTIAKLVETIQTDIIGTNSSLVILLTKILTDDTTAQDLYYEKLISKPITDLLTHTTEIALTNNKQLADAVINIDSVLKEYLKNINTTITSTETLGLQNTKPLSDTTSFGVENNIDSEYLIWDEETYTVVTDLYSEKIFAITIN